ncbi:MAG: hypothetical protein GEU73_15445 [Chloroflexi bacterium]|nr:hypothetical protein [Chloroflexota bacterium]
MALCRSHPSVEPLEITRVRGTNDVVPPSRAHQQSLEERLRDVFALYGYEPIDTPVLEPTDLFLRKSGEEIVARMYSFTHWNRNVCLRPEFTASVVRAYVSHLQDRPLPVRVQYAGPTFRYEKPQRMRHRQFTQVGIECIGADGPAADAEVLAAARHGIEAIGLKDWRVVIGHLGAVLQLLAQMGMEPHAQTLIIGAMEHLSRAPGEAGRVVQRLAALLGGDVVAGADESAGEDLVELLRSFGQDGATRVAAELLERANLRLEGGTRPPGEIIERLLHKAFRPDPTPALRRAIDFITRLQDLAGPPHETVPALRQLLAEFKLEDGPVREVERALECFDAYFDSPAPVQVDLSLARGLRYYTGLVFEIYDGEDNQLAGGGRYNDLVRALGGRGNVPACGFQYGLERVVAAVEREMAAPERVPAVAALVVPVDPKDYAAAARLAAALRAAGVASELDLRFRGLKANLRHADRERIPIVLFVGEKERSEGVVGLRDMRVFEEARLAPEDVVATVRRRLEAGVPSVAGPVG